MVTMRPEQMAFLALYLLGIASASPIDTASTSCTESASITGTNTAGGASGTSTTYRPPTGTPIRGPSSSITTSAKLPGQSGTEPCSEEEAERILASYAPYLQTTTLNNVAYIGAPYEEVTSIGYQIEKALQTGSPAASLEAAKAYAAAPYIGETVISSKTYVGFPASLAPEVVSAVARATALPEGVGKATRSVASGTFTANGHTYSGELPTQKTPVTAVPSVTPY